MYEVLLSSMLQLTTNLKWVLFNANFAKASKSTLLNTRNKINIMPRTFSTHKLLSLPL